MRRESQLHTLSISVPPSLSLFDTMSRDESLLKKLEHVQHRITTLLFDYISIQPTLKPELNSIPPLENNKAKKKHSRIKETWGS